MKKSIILVLVLASKLFSQFAVQNEEMSGGKYIVTFAEQRTNEYVTISQHIRTLSDKSEIDAPAREIFLSLPAGVTTEINVVPVRRSVVTQDDAVLQSDRLSERVSEFRGFLWIDGHYCAHLSIYPFYRDAADNQIYRLEEFRLEIPLSAGDVATTAKPSQSHSSIIDNPLFGTQWRSTNSMYKIQSTDTWIDYNKDYVKIGVVSDGIYRLRRSALQTLGVPVTSLNPRTFKMYLKGKEIPIFVFGEEDNSFNDDDYIEFVGRKNYGDAQYRQPAPFGSAYYEYLNRYSDTTIYWISWDGAQGQRIDTIISSTGTPADTLRHYDELTHQERNLWWDFSLNPNNQTAELRRNDPANLENETWHEGNLNVGKLSIQFSVSNRVSNKSARAFVKLQDYASGITANAHNLALSINNTATKYDSGFINKYQVKVLQANFSSTLLTNGTNTVDIHSFATASSINTVIRDWYELEYPRMTRTTVDSLAMTYTMLTSAVYATVAVSGLSGTPVSVYKYTLSDSTFRKVTNYVRRNDSLYFDDSVRNGTIYYLLAEHKIPSPIMFYKKKFANLRSIQRSAEYIAITHPYFLPSVTPYASFIASTYNVATSVVSVEDIYDEFNYGFFSPEPIKEFLKSAVMYWQTPKPKFVVLIGKGTYDFYGNKTRYLGAPSVRNFVPSYGNPVSDNWFVQWDTTASLVPQMSIGRIPARDLTEFQSYAVKHQKYVAKGFDDWNKRYLFFAGGNFNDPNQIAQSKGVNDHIVNNFVIPPPIGGSAGNFYKTTNPITNFGPYSPEYITNTIERGGVFISYIGHSGTQTWDNSITDISQLANTHDRSPMISDFGCSTAKFAEPDVRSFSELAVHTPQGQAIAYVGNSSLGFTSTAFSFPQVFYKKLLIDTSATLGDVHRLAKIDYIKNYGTAGTFGLFAKTNTLIGDPIVSLPIPKKPNLSITGATYRQDPEIPTDQTDSIRITFTYFNYGSVPVNDSLTLLLQSEHNGVIVYSTIIRKPIPYFSDSVIFVVPVSGKAGEHRISVDLDHGNTVDEIYETDNNFVRTILVATTSIRSLVVSSSFNQSDGIVTYLTPSAVSPAPSFVVEIGRDPLFSEKQTITVPYDTFYSAIQLHPSYSSQRVWVRSFNADGSGEGVTHSYYVDKKINFIINDSSTLTQLTYSGMKWKPGGSRMDTTRIVISAISAGLNDGSTAVITRSGQNFIPENTIRGHHIVLFDAVTYEYIRYYYFPIYSGTTIVNNYINALDTISSKYIAVFSISNEGQEGLSAALRTAIKAFGSLYIDSVKFWSSWAMIGRKGAQQGSVPEKYSLSFQGRVQIDTTISIPDTIGTFSTPSFGPVAEWKNIGLKYTEQSPGNISMNVIGIRSTGVMDTVKYWNNVDTLLDLSDVNASVYPTIALQGKMKRSIGEPSPTISSIEIDYNGLAELGTNYQTVRCFVQKNGSPRKEIQPGDTVLQGEKVDVVYRVYNVGGVPVKNVGVILTSQWDNNSIEQLSSVSIDSLGIRSYKEFTVPYNTSLGFGRRNIQVSIDPDTTVRELYRDNNFFVFPLVVKKNQTSPLLPNLTITAGGIRPSLQRITNEIDSVRFTIVYANTGALVNDSISIAVRHAYRGTPATEWLIRRKYPPSTDTISIDVPILKRSGEHSLSVELDQVGLIAESNESDNDATYFFTVFTTDFRIIQPAGISIAATERMIFLNPTSIENTLPAIANLEIDTVVNFTAPLSLQSPMTEFISEFPIAFLAKHKRFYWRIKQLNSQRDWTTGSFYRGDSSSFALGQVDSAGWMNNTFLRTSYDRQNGARIVDTKFAFKAISAGFSDGLNGSVELNGVNISAPIIGPGHNITVLDTVNYSVKAQRRFDVSNNAHEVDSLIVYLSTITSGDLVINVVVDDGANNMTVPARNAFKSIGSASIDNLAFRDSWAIIGTKGSAIGTALESYKPQGTGAAVIETTIVRKENSGRIVTQPFSTAGGLTTMLIDAQIPAAVRSSAFRTAVTQSAAELTTHIVGITEANVHDTVITVINQQSIPLQNFPVMHYPEMKIVFDLKSNAAFESPALQQWTISGTPPIELATSPAGVSISKLQVMEGEQIEFRGSVYNLGGVAAESVLVRINTLQSGLETTLKEERLAVIAEQETSVVTATFDSKGKKGSLAFRMVIDPLNEKVEVSKENNSVTIPFTITADSVRPLIAVTVDGRQIVNGDYIGQYPVIMIRYSDNNPTILTPADTTLFRIRLNNQFVPFTAGTAELTTTTSPGTAEVRWTPALKDGENIIQIFANDVTGMSSDTVTMFVNVASQFKLLDVYNIPNPFSASTHFTFNLAGPVVPEEVTIKIYTVAGRLIHEMSSPAIIGFNKINWDGRDKDGDAIGNGVYLYRVIVQHQEKQVTATSKLVKMR